MSLPPASSDPQPQNSPSSQPVSPIPAASVSSSHSPPVLIVESDTRLAHEMGVDLHEAGYTPLEVHGLRAGLTQARASAPALIVVARRLAEESGLDLCRQLRAEQNRVPILLM
ncbi:MAG: hypothetical protein AAFQ40_16435, partial [Cyanobacteria bacterium J06623_5]